MNCARRARDDSGGSVVVLRVGPLRCGVRWRSRRVCPNSRASTSSKRAASKACPARCASSTTRLLLRAQPWLRRRRRHRVRRLRPRRRRLRPRAHPAGPASPRGTAGWVAMSDPMIAVSMVRSDRTTKQLRTTAGRTTIRFDSATGAALPAYINASKRRSQAVCVCSACCLATCLAPAMQRMHAANATSACRCEGASELGGGQLPLKSDE